MLMSENNEATARSRIPIRLGVIAGGMLFYVLSIGPVAWAFNRTKWTVSAWFGDAMEIFYFPLGWSADQIPWLGDLLEWYVELF